ncbi:MAG TPA: YceI family protein [Vicinamibacterales bacterium]|nr:YceI family protein [Vicinamibacterales bacterium]
MNTATCLRAAAVASLVWSWSATSAVAQDRLHVADGDVTVVCPLTVGGSFEARTKALSGDVGPAPQQAGGVGGALLVKLDTLETGIGLRDHHMRENYLEVEKGRGYDVATIEDIQLEKADGKGTFKATLLLHGQKRQVTGTSIVHRRGDGTTHVDAEFPLKVSEFEIPKPTYLGVGVRDEIRVKVAFNALPMSTTASTR